MNISQKRPALLNSNTIYIPVCTFSYLWSMHQFWRKCIVLLMICNFVHCRKYVAIRWNIQSCNIFWNIKGLKFRTVLDLAVAKPICYDGFNRNSSDESIYKASRWSRLCPTKEKVPLWLNHAIFRGIIFYETIRLLLLAFFLPLISPSSSNYFFEFLVY